MAPVLGQVVCNVRAEISAECALNNATHYDAAMAYKRICDEPRCDACQCAGDGELEECWRGPRMQQQADARPEQADE